MCWRSMLPQRLKEILQCVLTHAHTASDACLPLNLLSARFRCVSQYSSALWVWGFSWLYRYLGSEQNSVYLHMSLWCMKAMGTLELYMCVLHALLLSNYIQMSVKKETNHPFHDFCQWGFHLTLSSYATSRCNGHITMRSLERANSPLKKKTFEFSFQIHF